MHDIVQLMETSSSTHKMVIIKKSVDQYKAQRICHSLCLALASFPTMANYARLNHFLYYHGESNQLYPNYLYHTGLQANATDMISVATNSTVPLQSITLNFPLIEGNLGDSLDGLVFANNDYDSFSLKKASPYEHYYFICEEVPLAEDAKGPLNQAFLDHAFVEEGTNHPNGLKFISDFFVKILELHLPNESGSDIVLLGDEMSLHEAVVYCRYIGGRLFEPENAKDIEMLSKLANKFEFPEMWVGIFARTRTFPRSKEDWKYISNMLKEVPDIVHNLFDEDNGVSFIGKIAKHLLTYFLFLFV